MLEIHIDKNAVATIDRAAKVHTERPELSGYYLPRILIASGGKKSSKMHFFNHGQGLCRQTLANTSQNQSVMRL